jgi:hypothetical protein
VAKRSSAGAQTETQAKPQWDGQKRELRYGGQLLKRYHVPAANQEILLAALEEVGWPERMDDPLPKKINGTKEG